MNAPKVTHVASRLVLTLAAALLIDVLLQELVSFVGAKDDGGGDLVTPGVYAR